MDRHCTQVDQSNRTDQNNFEFDRHFWHLHPIIANQHFSVAFNLCLITIPTTNRSKCNWIVECANITQFLNHSLCHWEGINLQICDEMAFWAKWTSMSNRFDATWPPTTSTFEWLWDTSAQHCAVSNWWEQFNLHSEYFTLLIKVSFGEYSNRIEILNQTLWRDTKPRALFYSGGLIWWIISLPVRFVALTTISAWFDLKLKLSFH